MTTITGDTLWILACGFLVTLMQGGFTCLESGLVRTKNSINVAIKNLIDFCISLFLYALFGYGLMFGSTHLGLIGTDHFMFGSGMAEHDYALFFFEAVFCGTAATIVSGAVAERMRFVGYIATTILLAATIYPVTGHWAWATGVDGGMVGWLGKIGFRDFAGSTVVHSVGGWIALSALIIIGPRIGRFGKNGHPIEGHSLPIATVGVFLLWFGWFGFNGGSTLRLSSDIPLIIVNTAMSGAVGGIGALAATWYRDGRPLVDRVMNGVIAGLVGITAGCNLVDPMSAMAIGFISGLIVVYGAPLLENWGIDDAIGAVPVHLMAGVWGTLAVAIFAPSGSWGDEMSRLSFLGVQFLGIAAIGIYSFGTSFIVLSLLNKTLPLRVNARDERIGLNISEHGATTSILDLITQMDEQARSGNFSKPVEVEPETEAAPIAAFYNTVLEKFLLETGRRQMAMQKLNQMANYDVLTGLVNRRFFFESVKHALSRAKRNKSGGAVLYFDLDGFKAVNDNFGHEAGDQVLKETALRLAQSVRENDILGRLGGDEFALLIEDTNQPIDNSCLIADKIIQRIGESYEYEGQSLHIGVSIGIAIFDHDHKVNVKTVVSNADHAMYQAKLAGKGVYRIHNPEE